MSDGGISKLVERPTQLLVKASFDRSNGLTRRIPFRELNKVTFSALKGRVADCFALSSNFSIAYKDDDGDEIVIENDDDLAEALDYMLSGEEGYTSKCIMKVFIVLGYEGPNLSQSGTFRSERTRGSGPRRTDHYGSESSSNGRRRPHDSRGMPSIEQHQWSERHSGASRSASHTSHNNIRGPSDLREGVLDSSSDGRVDLERRWLLESARGSSPHESVQSSVTRTTADRNDSLAIFRQEELDKLNSLVQTFESPELLRCKACEERLIDLRFVCMTCGPLQRDSDSPISENDASSSDHRSIGEGHHDSSKHICRGYELCEGCIEVQGSKHMQTEESNCVHVFIEAHKALDSRGWRVVEYAEPPTCNVCGTGPLSLQAHRCLVCAHCDLCSACFAAVKVNHAGHAFQILPPVFPSSTIASQFGLGRGLTRKSSASSKFSARSSDLSYRSSVHAGCYCQGCGDEISGPRFSCATCPTFDLCSSCEEDETFVRDRERGHDSTHIMLKAKLPLPDHAFRQARDRAESLASGYDGDKSSVGGYVRPHPHHPSPSPDYWRHGPPPGPPGHFDRGPPPPRLHGRWGPPPPPWDWAHGPGPGPPPGPPPPQPWHHPWRGPKHHGHGKGPHGPPPIYLINTGGAGSSVQRLDSLDQLSLSNAGRMNLPHGVSCSSCSQSIFGVRWLCANCPTQPTVDLCDNCEAAGAGASHDLMHAWLRVCIPISRPLDPRRALLPILYQRQKLGSDRGTVIGSEFDSVSDNAVAISDAKMHANVLCDECLQPFSSCWYRCATCPSSPDLCEACFSRGSSKHDMNHIYIKLAHAVDMALFKALTSHTSGAGARPLITF